MALQLFARLPSLRSPRKSESVIPPGARESYPALADDLELLDTVVLPAFQESDLAALRHQNSYRRQQVTILVGSVVASGLGGLQALLTDQAWPGVLLALLGVALAASSHATSELGTQNDYLAERAKAERLRATYFRFLSRTGRYAGADRNTVLRRAVVAIKAGREPR
jgi:hypothetical protein